jgi:hypothetical protein
VILEAFAKYLHSADPAIPAPAILGRWLWERLTTPPQGIADRVLRAEVNVEVADKNSDDPQVRGWSLSLVPGYVFAPTSESGRRLLRSLYEYASSYEQQKWSRWVHCVKASDFNRLYNQDR